MVQLLVNHKGRRDPASLEAPPGVSLGERIDAVKRSKRVATNLSPLDA